MAGEDRPGLRTSARRKAAVLLASAVAACPVPPAHGRDGRAAGPSRVCVYYDAGDDPASDGGRLHAIMLENLLGHFREAQASLLPVAEYSDGTLKDCSRAAYVGVRFNAALPEGFLRDVAASEAPFLWLNYNVWQLQSAMGPERFSEKAGFLYRSLRRFDPGAGKDGIPDFFRYFDYKGERFAKLAFVGADGAVVAAPEISVISTGTAEILASAVDSGSGETTPYAVRKGPFFYFADDPFVYAHEQDRYLILADVLFDFLGVPPRAGRRLAFLRLEDIHPNYDLKLLYRVIDVLKAKGVPFAVSLIPKYVPAGKPEEEGVDLAQKPEFLKALRYAEANGGEIVLHGYTHNATGLPDCPSLASGADYEFWDRCRQEPLPDDSEPFVRARIAKARALLDAAGLSASAWVTPHYTASPEDFIVFGRLFSRTLQRVRYVPGGPASGAGGASVNQFFPYTIYRDHYGQFVWPENLGFVPMPGSDSGGHQTLDIAASAKRSRVVRDAWASFFWHPQLVNTPGEIERLEKTIDDIRASGFEFVSLKSLRARGE